MLNVNIAVILNFMFLFWVALIYKMGAYNLKKELKKQQKRYEDNTKTIEVFNAIEIEDVKKEHKKLIEDLQKNHTTESMKIPGLQKLDDVDNICLEDHEWVDSWVSPPGSNLPEKKEICIECGIIKDYDLMLNAKALENLQAAKDVMEEEHLLNEEVAKLLSFEMSRFYDAWLTQNKETLMPLLEDGADIEKLHDLWSDFLHQGTIAANELSAQIIQDLRGTPNENTLSGQV